jgi:TPR repeat protein
MAAQLSLSFPRLIVALLIAGVLAACVSTTEMGGGDAAVVTGDDARRIDDLVLVDCLLPGQIHQLGTKMTFLAPRRRVKTTKSDCGIRGGEFVLFDRSDYKAALQTLLPQAQSGDEVAQTYVGEIFEKGLGLSAPDYGTAALWYRKAAEQGYRPAQTNLGLLYERGRGVAQNKTEALNWYRKATGLSEDTLVFESSLKAKRAMFRREIALRNHVVSNLQEQLSRANASTRPGAASTSERSRTGLEQVATSMGREVAREKEQVQREIHAVQQLEKAEDAVEGKPGESSSSKKAQMKKLELSLRQELDGLDDNQQRLTSL